MQPLIITLDGPAGSGKSTIARRLAQRLGLEFLDTGAMYRGLTALCLDDGIDPAANPQAVVDLARRFPIRFDWRADPPRLQIGERDLTDRLRDPDVTFSVSDTASIGGVRQLMVEAQRQIAADHPRLVTEGRDQGSVVFPLAQVKVYLDASPAVRAKRRAEEIRRAGKAVDEEQVLDQITRRDHRDQHRSDGPLICPPDALVVDTSAMTLDGVLDHLERLVRQRVSQLQIVIAGGVVPATRRTEPAR
jgi:cytidylate kinase